MASWLFGVALLLASADVALAQPTVSQEPTASPPLTKPKRTPPVPVVTVVNATGATATKIVLSAPAMSVTLPKPLAAKATSRVRLPKLKGCTVNASVMLKGEENVRTGEFDVCKDRTLRLTD